MKRVATVGALVILAACGSSPPAAFYTLDVVHPSAPPPSAVANVPVQVEAVHVPAALDRQEIVRESAASRLAIDGLHRWGAPFGEMIRRTLTQDLAARLPAGMVVFPDEPAPSRMNAIVVDILQFDQDPSGNIVFDGSWSLLAGGADTSMLSRHLRLSEPAGSQSYSDQAKTMSRMLGELADKIVAGVTSFGHGT